CLVKGLVVERGLLEVGDRVVGEHLRLPLDRVVRGAVDVQRRRQPVDAAEEDLVQVVADAAPAVMDVVECLLNRRRRRPVHQYAMADLELRTTPEANALVYSHPGPDRRPIYVLVAGRRLRQLAVRARKGEVGEQQVLVGGETVRLPTAEEGDVERLD